MTIRGLLSGAAVLGCIASIRDRETHEAVHTGPASSGLGEGLAGWDVLVPSRSRDSLCRAGRMHADFGHQLYGVSADTLVRLGSGLCEQ